MTTSEGQLSTTTTSLAETANATHKIRVLHIIGTLSQGGSERQGLQLAALMKQNEHFDVELATLEPEGPLREEATKLGFSEIPAYPLNSFFDWNMAAQVRRCAARLHSSQVSLIHTHDFYSNIFGILAGILAGVPVRVASRRELGGMRSSAQKWVERRVYTLAHGIVVNSEAVRRQLIREGVPQEKTRVIYNGLDFRRVDLLGRGTRDQMLRALGLPLEGSRRYVTIVANLRHDVKDHPMFLRAAERVARQIPEACFIVAGEGDLLDSMRSLASQLKIQDRTCFLGRCELIAVLLAISDVCVLSSRFEGFSNSILEYMAAGRAVVATDVGGAREAIIEGETGFLVAAGDDTAMAERIVGLLRNPQKARVLGEKGRRVVREKFSCRAQLKNTEEFYWQLLRGRALSAVGML